LNENAASTVAAKILRIRNFPLNLSVPMSAMGR
jgi:hypothetical protein